MTRSQITLICLGVVALGMLLFAPSVFFVIFAGALGAILLRWGGRNISQLTGAGEKAGVGLFALAIVLALAAVFGMFAPAVAEQADQLSNSIPDALSRISDTIGRYQWGQSLISHLSPEQLLSGGIGSTATSALSSTFGALGNFVLIVFIALYGALSPGTYKNGLLALFPPDDRDRSEKVSIEAACMLKGWLKAQLISMSVVGILTAIGLWAIGLPLAPLLGLIAGLFAFIPNIGPILALVPALSLAMPEGLHLMALVVLVNVAVQAIESYIVTPLVQQSETSLPPALIIAAQLLFGALFGIMGLALATPLCALAIVLTRELYVKDWLLRPSRTEIEPHDA